MKTFLLDIKTSLLLTLVLAVLLCGAYPLVVWAGGQVFFADQANGSLIADPDGTVRGSALLAQSQDEVEHLPLARGEDLHGIVHVARQHRP